MAPWTPKSIEENLESPGRKENKRICKVIGKYEMDNEAWT